LTELRFDGRAVINNAGIHDPGLFEELTVDRYRTMLDVHYFGALFVTKAAWPHLIESGSGQVVNTVSEAMLGGIPELSSYGAAKGASRTISTPSWIFAMPRSPNPLRCRCDRYPVDQHY